MAYALVERQTLTVDESAVYLGIGRQLAYKMANDGRLPTIRMGKRMLVPRAALDQLLSVPTPIPTAPNG